MAENGSHVTWREMNLILAPMEELKDEVHELTVVVQRLVSAHARGVGAAEVRDERRVMSLYWRPALVAAFVSGVATVVGAHL